MELGEILKAVTTFLAEAREAYLKKDMKRCITNLAWLRNLLKNELSEHVRGVSEQQKEIELPMPTPDE